VAVSESSPFPAGSPSPEPIVELVELGQRLRRAREGRGIGVAELADRLHLAPEQLTALENGDRLHLHEPVFVIAQAKRVAQALGVDVSPQVESLRQSRLMQPPVPAPNAATVLPSGHASPTTSQASGGTPFRWFLAAAFAGLALLLGLVGIQSFRLLGQRRPVPAAVPAASELAPSAAATAAPGVLLLRSDQPSWVEVRNGEGQVLFSGLLENEARFRLSGGLRVLAGRPDLVTATVAGEAPRRLGSISQVDWQDFAPAPSAPTPPPAPAPAP
jgi:cytoskeleton protein RodZ